MAVAVARESEHRPRDARNNPECIGTRCSDLQCHVRARIRKTVDFAESVQTADYADASSRKVSLSWAPGKVIGGEDYLLQMTIPNTFFHISMAYALLRHNGVDVGKMDFLGPINLVDASGVGRDI